MNNTSVSATNDLSNNSLSRLQAAVEPYGYPLIRLTAGLLLAPHGAQKLFGWFGGDPAATVAIFDQIGLHPAALLVPLVGAIEFFGGLAVAFGILTRLSALACAVVLAVATLVLIPRGYFWMGGGLEYALFWMLVFLGIAMRGGGQLSLDSRFSRS